MNDPASSCGVLKARWYAASCGKLDPQRLKAAEVEISFDKSLHIIWKYSSTFSNACCSLGKIAAHLYENLIITS